jgi:hypothetical protein
MRCGAPLGQYPSKIAKEARTPAVEAELQALLDLVGIGYLVGP